MRGRSGYVRATVTGPRRPHRLSHAGLAPGAPGSGGPSRSQNQRETPLHGAAVTKPPPALQRGLRSASVTRSSVVKGRSVGRDGTARRSESNDGVAWELGLRPLTHSGYPVGHDSGVRPLTQPAPPRDLCDDCNLAGGEAAQGGWRGCDRPGSREPASPTPASRQTRVFAPFARASSLRGERRDSSELRAAAAVHPFAAVRRYGPVNADNIGGVERVASQSTVNVCFTCSARVMCGDSGHGVGVVSADRVPVPRAPVDQSSPGRLAPLASCEMAIVAEVSRWCRLGERPDPGVMADRIAEWVRGRTEFRRRPSLRFGSPRATILSTDRPFDNRGSVVTEATRGRAGSARRRWLLVRRAAGGSSAGDL